MALQDHELVASTLLAQWLGFLMPALGIVVVLCVGVAARKQAVYTRKRRELRYEHLRTAFADSVRLLVLVVLDVERDAVIQAAAAAGGPGAAPDTAGGHAIFRLGRLGKFEVILAQATQGTVTPTAMMPTADRLIEALRPDYVVLSGICFGLWSRELDGGDQDLGDVVVSEYVQNIDHRRITTEHGVERTRWRGERVQATRALLTAFETIHPFLDGNGRVGRCLIHTVLARRHLASRMLVPVSLVLAAYGDHYIDGLVDFREGRIDQWCGTFASAARLAVEGAAQFEQHLATMISRWRLESEARPGSHLWRACEQTTITPIFTVTSLRDELRCSATAATEAIERLERIGIVAQVSLGRRNRVYLNRSVLRLLDDFERDLLSAADGTAGRLRTSARAKTAIPPAVLPSVEHALLESFPLGADPPPSATTLAAVSGYRPDQVRQVLDRLAADTLVERAGAHGWILTAKGHRLRAMIRANEDLRRATG